MARKQIPELQARINAKLDKLHSREPAKCVSMMKKIHSCSFFTNSAETFAGNTTMNVLLQNSILQAQIQCVTAESSYNSYKLETDIAEESLSCSEISKILIENFNSNMHSSSELQAAENRLETSKMKNRKTKRSLCS